MLCTLLTAAAVLSAALVHAGPQSIDPDRAHADQPPDLILHSGIVWTVDDANPTAQAIAIRGEKIVAVGRNSEVLPLRGEQTRVVDLECAFVVPGFSDNHIHFASAAAFHEFNIMNVQTQEQFVDRVREVVDRLPDGEWIVGGLWGAYDQWAAGTAGGQAREAFSPDMRLIEELTAAHPMFIRRFDNSEFAVNSAALRAAGLDPAAPDIAGVEFVRDAEGEWTGVMRGIRAFHLFRNVMPSGFSRERRLQQTRHALKMLAAAGVTNVSDMSDDMQLDLYRELHELGELTTRIHFRYTLDRWQEVAAKGVRIGSGDAWIRLGGLKGFIDGIMGTSSARFFEPYEHQPDNRGRWRDMMYDEQGNIAPQRFLDMMLGADRAGLQLTIHAIGDEANHVLLNFLEDLHTHNGEKDRRFRLVHAQVLAQEDFPRLGKLGVIAEVQPFHLSDDMRWMEERIGYQRCRGAYAFRSIVDSGATLCFGTDWPGTSAAEYPINPMLGLYAAVTRQTILGEPMEGWFPEQCIRIDDAIRAYTLNTAYANFEDDIKGSITVGKLADIVVLDRNLLTIRPSDLLDVNVLYTIVGGRIVYQREEN